MSLPIFQSDSKDLLLLQTNWALQINPVIDAPMNRGNILKSITLTSGVTNFVNHKLSRNLQGWFICRQRSAGKVYDIQDSNTTPNVTLNLITDTTVSVDLFVF